MRGLLISLAAAGSALAVASPATAQYYPAQRYGYGQGYGYNNYGQVRALQARVDALQWQINRRARVNAIGAGRAGRLREESRQIEWRLHEAARYGLNPYEAHDIQTRIARLEQRVHYGAAHRYGQYSRGYNDYHDRGYYNYDREGRHDGDRNRDRDDDD